MRRVEGGPTAFGMGEKRRGEKRRPYVPPSVQAFGRKLPAFAPPSPPQNSPKPWEP